MADGLVSLRRSRFDWFLELISLAATVGAFAVVALHWAALPNRIPTHFGLSGKPNAWGSKSAIWLLPGISAVLYVLLTLAARHQRLVNLPISIDRERPEVRQLIFRFVNLLKAIIAAVLFYLVWGSVETALGGLNGLGGELLPIILAATFVPVVVYLLKLRRYRHNS